MSADNPTGRESDRKRLDRSPRRNHLHHWLGCALLAACAVFAQPSVGQAKYPVKPVRLVVSYAPGNVTDLLARMVAEQLAVKWGQPVVVDNRAGQGGSLGADIVAKAPPDGYTLLFSAMAALAINPHVYPSVGYDPLKDFVPVVDIASPAIAIVVATSLKVSTFQDLVAYGKANPSALFYGSAGNGTAPHLNIEALKQQTGLAAQHVPYKSAPAVTADVVAGRIQIQQDALSVLLPQITAGRVVAIAAGGDKRLSQLPNVPSISEAIPGFRPIVPWLGILAPAGTPADIVARINDDVHAILQQPELVQKLAAQGLTVTYEGPEQFARTLATDYARLGKLVKELNVKVD